MLPVGVADFGESTSEAVTDGEAELERFNAAHPFYHNDIVARLQVDIYGPVAAADVGAEGFALEAAEDEYSEEAEKRLYMMWGMIDHDLPHGAEIALILGAEAEATAVNWSGRRAASTSTTTRRIRYGMKPVPSG